MDKIKKVMLSTGREVEVQPLKMKMIRKASSESSDMDMIYSIVSQATGLSISEIDELGVVDFLLLQEALNIPEAGKALIAK